MPPGEPSEENTMNANLQLLFPTVVQVSQIPNHEALNSDISRVIEEVRHSEPNRKPQSWACDLYTTIGSPKLLLNHAGLAEFTRIIDLQIREYAQALNYDIDRYPLTVSECWVNIYGSQHSQEIHLHKNSLISGIYYVKAPAGSGATLFYSPQADDMISAPIKLGNNLNATVTGFPPVEGRMLLFRSSLRHSVLPGTMDGERITLAFNATL